MNHTLWNRVAAKVLALTFVIAAAAACDRHHDANVSGSSGAAALPASADASARTIDVAPAPSTGDPAGTTAVAPGTSDISKQAERTGPREGDNHSYSSVAPDNPQKAHGVDPQQTQDRTDRNTTEAQPK